MVTVTPRAATPSAHPRDGQFCARRTARVRTTMAAVASLTVLSIAALTGAPPARAANESPVLSAPLEPLAVERLASLPQRPWLAGHRGLDLSARVGQPVGAPAAGVVTFVGFVVDRPVLSIRHSQGLVSSFEPIDSELAVGDTVDRGQLVGTVATVQRHCSPKTCLHWGVRLGGMYVDPLDYLEGFGPVTLLPSASG